MPRPSSPRRLRLGAATLAAVLAFAGGAAAQTPVQPQPRDPNMPAPQNTPPERIEPAPGGSAPGTLSDRLERSDGVIRPPPSADTGMVRPAPETGTTPVIPPAGTPGSARPNADPK